MTALAVSVPVVVSAVVANSTTPGFVAVAVSAVTVTSPVAPLTSIPSPATIEVTFASVCDVAIEVPFQVPVDIVPTVVIFVLPEPDITVLSSKIVA